MDLSARLAALSDPDLPAAGLMFGEDAAAMLGTAQSLFPVPPVEATPRQILWQPGRQLVVRYKAKNRGLPGTESDIVAATGDAIPAQFKDGDAGQVLAWKPADDPWLPGLGSVLSTQAVSDMLRSLGVEAGPIRLTIRVYRPTRRAVIQVAHPQTTLYIKVVPPAAVAGLDAMHRELAPRIRIPRSLGWSKELGIAVLEALPGRTLRAALADGTAELPAPGSLVGLLDGLPQLETPRQVGGPTSSVPRHVGLLRRVVPECGDLLDELLERCSPAPAGDMDDAVHGDFYENQVLVEGASITGLIDIDRMGTGRRIDDFGMFTGHLAAFAMSAPDPDRVRTYGASLVTAADTVVDPTELRRVAAAALVAMAAGPFRVQSPDWPTAVRRRLEAALDWLDSADRLATDETSLTPASASPHRAARG